MKFQWNLSQQARQAIFAKTGELLPITQQGEVDITKLSNDERKFLFDKIKGALDVTGESVLSEKIQTGYSTAAYAMKKFYSGQVDAQNALQEYLENALHKEDELRKIQEAQMVENGIVLRGNEPLTSEMADLVERHEAEMAERQRKSEEAAKRNQEAREKRAAERKKQEEEAEKIWAEMQAWAKDHGSELLQLRIEQEANWKELSLFERAQQIVGYGAYIGFDEDFDYKELGNPSLEVMKEAKRIGKVMKDFPFFSSAKPELINGEECVCVEMIVLDTRTYVYF